MTGATGPAISSMLKTAVGGDLQPSRMLELAAL